MSGKTDSSARTLRRELGLPGAVMLGLGSILGTGVFVSLGVAAGVAGPAVIVGIVLAAALAAANGLSSAQLAANYPVSGGTYEYGYQYASARLGFLAGWTFLLAKSASAATAALGLAGYLLVSVDAAIDWLVPVALGGLLIITLIVLSGMRRTSLVNGLIVTLTLLSLIAFVAAGLPTAIERGGAHWQPFWPVEQNDALPMTLRPVLEAAALMFVAYTGYGRIATLGEEIREPRRGIPRAIILTLIVSMLLYVSVGMVAIATVGSVAFAEATTARAAPLGVVAESFGAPAVLGIPGVLALGAITAMAGVLLNLLLGLSRVLLAMGRRRDMPAATAALNRAGTTPHIAVITIAIVIGCLVSIGSIKPVWSFSAFTVLVYYAITNWCAIQLPASQRLYPRWIAWTGLIGCLTLAFFVEWHIWVFGLGVLIGGLIWHALAERIRNGRERERSSPSP